MTDIKQSIVDAITPFIFEAWNSETETNIHEAIKTALAQNNFMLETINFNFNDGNNSLTLEFVANGRKFEVIIEPTPVNFEDVPNE